MGPGPGDSSQLRAWLTLQTEPQPTPEDSTFCLGDPPGAPWASRGTGDG